MRRPSPRLRFLAATVDADSRSSVGRVLVNTAVPDRPTRVHVLTTPKGMLGVATCRACGGRHEHLLHCRGPFADPGAATDALTDVLTRWVMGHECPAPEMPEPVLDAADAEVDRAVLALAQGVRSRPNGILVMPRGKRLALHLPDLSGLPGRQQDETYAQVAHTLRQAQIREGRHAIGLVVLRLTRPSLSQPLAQVTVTCASSQAAVVGRVPVRLQSGGRPRRGGKWTWAPIAGPHPCIDGVLATPAGSHHGE